MIKAWIIFGVLAGSLTFAYFFHWGRSEPGIQPAPAVTDTVFNKPTLFPGPSGPEIQPAPAVSDFFDSTTNRRKIILTHSGEERALRIMEAVMNGAGASYAAEYIQ